MKNFFRGVPLVALLAIVLAGAIFSCSKKGGTGSTTIVYSPTPNISILDNRFSPQNDSVAVGTTITWTFSAAFAHSVTSDAGLFDTTLTTGGQTFSRTFSTAGQYNYHCKFHGLPGSGMFGRIKVQ